MDPLIKILPRTTLLRNTQTYLSTPSSLLVMQSEVSSLAPAFSCQSAAITRVNRQSDDAEKKHGAVEVLPDIVKAQLLENRVAEVAGLLDTVRDPQRKAE